MTVRLRRSELATPGSQEKMILRAAASDADLVFLDLEDAVAPAEKERARRPVIEAVNGLDWGRKTRAVRINGVDTAWAHDDIIDIVSGAGSVLDIIIIPKVKAPRDVWFVDTLLAQLEAKLGLTHRIGLEALIEETEALARVEEIAGCSSRLEALILGVGDLSASQGIRIGYESDPALRYPGDIWHYARSRMIVAARANGLDAIDGPYPNYRDDAGYRRDATWGATLGCVGKWCIHPAQIAIANEVFSPTEKEIALARRMCEAYEAAQGGGEGAAGQSGVLVDAASVRIFEGVLERARLTGKA
ncbi:MAG: CoA ester lyase [Chloroflexi bacterium]|nr:MAG: CoA ester lyase [Chloroflexota bacterium]